jgi:two-component system, LytTR family, response regulator LytT
MRSAGIKKGNRMKIIVDEDQSLDHVEVIFRTPRIDADVIEAVSRLRLFDQKLTGQADGVTHIVPAKDVLYFESVDKKTFFYTADKVFETQMRLYEIEDKLANCSFVRIGKSIVVNLKEVTSLKSDVAGKMIATLSNGERAVISRAYTPLVKQKLGL